MHGNLKMNSRFSPFVNCLYVEFGGYVSSTILVMIYLSLGMCFPIFCLPESQEWNTYVCIYLHMKIHVNTNMCIYIYIADHLGATMCASVLFL